MGLKDDLGGVNSSTKFLLQFIVAAILVILGDIRLNDMFGILGITTLPYFVSVVFSILLIMLIVNAFNLIDGIDGLASTTAIIANSTFGILFIYLGHYQLAAVAFAMVGAIAGFLKYNVSPAKIFMGDTGSLLIGLISAVMALKFIEISKNPGINYPQIFSAPALTVAILIGPVFDTLRVFTIRIANGTSPFTADRNHIHHRILSLGLNHIQTTLLLAGINILSIIIVLLFSNIGNTALIITIISVSLLFNWMITFLLRSKKRESLAFRNLFV